MDDKDIKINTLENNYKSMSEKIDELKEAVSDGFTEMKKDFKDFRESCDKKYASKRIETVVDKLTWLVISSVVLTVLGLIIIK